MWTTGARTRSVEIGGRCIKKSLASAPIQERHAIIERLREQMPGFSVRKLCRLLQINRQWYYQHRCPTAHQERDQQLRQAIQQLLEAFVGYGYRRVTKALVRAGWKVNHKRVWRVMRQAGLTRTIATRSIQIWSRDCKLRPPIAVGSQI